MKGVTPLFRIFDVEKAKEFYIQFLEFTIDWEHRYEAELPLYMQISNGDCVIHLTEHHGDCSPGSAIRVEVDHINNLHTKLISKKYKYARPGLEDEHKEMCIKDPFGNQITFFEKVSK
ncbi:glyoxalase superfamily protein [Paenibacillus sp. FA6]|uniref:glyoxalase superfamily protein n=1 Tax=Paenibacillus sp. FA6 TaxID=3413029 RepID=UPI003F658990